MKYFIFPFSLHFSTESALFSYFLLSGYGLKGILLLILWPKKDGSYDFFYDICRISWTIKMKYGIFSETNSSFYTR